jgi:hypothetical protein
MQFRGVLAIGVSLIIIEQGNMPIECWAIGSGFKLVETKRKLRGIRSGFDQIKAGWKAIECHGSIPTRLAVHRPSPIPVWRRVIGAD